jgi:hypothetical protein
MHAALRAALAQAVAWGMIKRNPAIGIKLPKKKTKKPTVLLTFPQIKTLMGNSQLLFACKLLINWSGREDLNLRPPGPELTMLYRINSL